MCYEFHVNPPQVIYNILIFVLLNNQLHSGCLPNLSINLLGPPYRINGWVGGIFCNFERRKKKKTGVSSVPTVEKTV